MRYIVSVDDSEASREAVDLAVQYAKRIDATLELVHAAQRSPENNGNNGSGPVLQSREEAETRGLDVLERCKSWANNDEVKVKTTLLWGKPGDAIANYADDQEADCVFVGHRGLSSRHEELVGSTAKRLIGQTNIPVMVATPE